MEIQDRFVIKKVELHNNNINNNNNDNNGDNNSVCELWVCFKSSTQQQYYNQQSKTNRTRIVEDSHLKNYQMFYDSIWMKTD